jgi:hypothetical protein
VFKAGASKKSLTSSIIEVPDFEVEMEIGDREVKMEENEYHHPDFPEDFEDDNSGIAVEGELESDHENNEIKKGGVDKNNARKSKVKALQFIKESVLKHGSPSKSGNPEEKDDFKQDEDSSE